MNVLSFWGALGDNPPTEPHRSRFLAATSALSRLGGQQGRVVFAWSREPCQGRGYEQEIFCIKKRS